MSMKKSSDTVGNRTHDLSVCSAVPQPLRHSVPHTYVSAFYFNFRNPSGCELANVTSKKDNAQQSIINAYTHKYIHLRNLGIL
jgi:hypothetical protein